MKRQSGQAIIILLLIMLVALSVGLAITQRSLNNISNSNKGEDQSRAFTAAESGIEQALYSGSTSPITNLNNQASATITTSPSLPDAPSHQALEYPPIGKETTAQFWLANPTDLSLYYPSSSNVYIYFGNYTSNFTSSDTPAIEVSLISKNSTNYTTSKRFFDPLSSRRSLNGFEDPGCPNPSQSTYLINTSSSADTTTADRNFRCMATITTTSDQPIMLRIRILYSAAAQALAVKPISTSSLPSQATIYTSVGVAGNAQKKLQLFKMSYVVPFYFDYSIFSAGDIKK